jgi:hypothetical protein
LISNNLCGTVSGPEKAGVGGSIPSLATILFNNLSGSENGIRVSRTSNMRKFLFRFHFWRRSSGPFDGFGGAEFPATGMFGVSRRYNDFREA